MNCNIEIIVKNREISLNSIKVFNEDKPCIVYENISKDNKEI